MRFFKIYAFIKKNIIALRNLMYLIITFKFIKYYKTEKRIIQNLSKFKKSRILLLSGGESVHKYWANVKYYDYVALNSYNSFNILNDDQKLEIKEKVLIYYQAPYHQPIILQNYNENVDKVANSINENCFIIHNKNGNKKIFWESDKNVNFKVYANLNLLGFEFIHSSGFYTLLNILISAGFRNIDLLGVDLDYHKSITFKSIDDLIHHDISEAELFLTIKNFKTKINKRKSVSIINLNPNSYFNLI